MKAKSAERHRKKVFTLKQAEELLPRVRRITSDAFERLESAYSNSPAEQEQEQGEEADDDAREKVEAAANQIVNAWAREILSLGCEIKGLWLVDFDTGDGYYCWKHPEERIEYFHTYEDGFTGRMKIN